LGGCLSCEALLILSLEVVSVPHQKDVINQSCPCWNPRWLQKTKTESKQDNVKWRQRDRGRGWGSGWSGRASA
jgi:hypothetical protein